MKASLWWLPIVPISLVGCGDPLRDCRIEALGEELPAVPPGPDHRAGQPCLWCHGSYGGVAPTMSVAGTLFQQGADGPAPAPGYLMRIVDSDGNDTYVGPSTCGGNVYAGRDDLDPGFPIVVSIHRPDLSQVAGMDSRIGRDGSCAGCHSGRASSSSPGLIVLADPSPPSHDCGSIPSAPLATNPSCTGGP